jgi:hypothetical protein
MQYQTYTGGYLAAEFIQQMERRMATMKEKKKDGGGKDGENTAAQEHPALPEVNEVTLVGRLSNTPRLKNYGEGKDRAQFTLAVPRPKRKEDAKPFYDYIAVVGWGAVAKQCDGLAKDDGLQIQGRIKSWQDPENKRLHWEIAADGVKVLDRATGDATPKQEELAGV